MFGLGWAFFIGLRMRAVEASHQNEKTGKNRGKAFSLFLYIAFILFWSVNYIPYIGFKS